MFRVKKSTEDLTIIKREVNTRRNTSHQKNHLRETTIKTRLGKRTKIIKIRRNKTINQLKPKRINYKRKNQ